MVELAVVVMTMNEVGDEIGSKTAEKNSAQTNKQRDRQTDTTKNNGHLAVNQ